LAELHPVEQIEKFRPELQAIALFYLRRFAERKVPIRDSSRSQVGVQAAFRTEREGRGRRKAGCVEPFSQSGLSGAGD
jgi:hypothetical protein